MTRPEFLPIVCGDQKSWGSKLRTCGIIQGNNCFFCLFFLPAAVFLRSGFKFEPHQILQTFLQSWDTAECKLSIIIIVHTCQRNIHYYVSAHGESFPSILPPTFQLTAFFQWSSNQLRFPNALFTWQMNATLLMIMYCYYCLKYFCMSVIRTWLRGAAGLQELRSSLVWPSNPRPRQKTKQTEYASSQKKKFVQLL